MVITQLDVKQKKVNRHWEPTMEIVFCFRYANIHSVNEIREFHSVEHFILIGSNVVLIEIKKTRFEYWLTCFQYTMILPSNNLLLLTLKCIEWYSKRFHGSSKKQELYCHVAVNNLFEDEVFNKIKI